MRPCDSASNFDSFIITQEPECIDEGEIDRIFNDASGKITTITEEYDLETGSLNILPKDYFFTLSTKLYN